MAPSTAAITQPDHLEPIHQAPLVPEAVLRQHACFQPGDHRFKAAARLLQSLWREDKGLPAGTFVTPEGHRRRLGSKLNVLAGQIGANFLTPAIAQLAWHEAVHCEIGAVYDTDRLRLNLLSSQPLAFNAFGPLKLDLDLATRVVAELLPGFMAEVTDIRFEHAPARGHPAFTGDHTAFDLLIRGRTTNGQRAFIAIELKYAEAPTGPSRPLHTRYTDLAPATGLFIDPAAKALRSSSTQQLFRQHCLAQAMLQRDLAEVGNFILIAPRLNHLTHAAATSYRQHLVEPTPAHVPFVTLTLEQLIEALAAAGQPKYAQALHRRYTDFHTVEGEIELAQAEELRAAQLKFVNSQSDATQDPAPDSRPALPSKAS